MLDLSNVDAVVGSGTIRETGKADVIYSGAVYSGLHFDIKAGELSIGSSYGPFDGVIGPTQGNGPALGPDAKVDFYPEGFRPEDVQSAKFDSSTGLLSVLRSSGQDLADFHFAGNASGLNVSVQNYTPEPGTVASYLEITDHPGATSPIPITFTT